MVIEFLCPNGHKIRCADDRANKPAKCPKCGVKFYVPGPEEMEPSESGAWATAPVQASGSPGSSSSKMASRDQIEFLCPNGHRLWAAVALQGRPGQCPECGSKFHIPTLADYEQQLRRDPRRRTRSSISRISPPRSSAATRPASSPASCRSRARTLFKSLRQGQPGGRLPHPPGRKSARGQRSNCGPATERCSARNSSPRNSATVRRWLSPSRPTTTPTPCFCFRGRRSRGSKSVELNASPEEFL